MLLTPGERLGPYDIVALVGTGGMGEVYRAHDSRLGRDVAVKVSAEQFSDRFAREAKVVASLNHPHICTLHDVGPNYLVMEFVEGPTLADRIAEGPVPLDEALGIARQVAEALEAAHEHGVVHRDLKPGNVKVRPDGSVKVLDFGLAKQLGAGAAVDNAGPTMTPTMMSPTLMTNAGMILGTAAYMAPEQARGRAVDKRADIWAFGVVLYEMLTGARLFKGEDLTETLASVVKDQPALDGLPARVKPLLARCLEKDPRKRLRDIGDAMTLVELAGHAAAERVVGSDGAASPSLVRRVLWPGVAAVLALALGTTALTLWPQPRIREASLRFQVALPEGTTANLRLELSPDGRKIADLLSDGRLWVHDLQTGEWRSLTEADGRPIWSPDSRYLAFPHDQKVKRIEATGGAAQTIADFARIGTAWGGAAWSSQDVLLFAVGGSGLYQVPVSGGEPRRVTTQDASRERFHQIPLFLPDGRHFAYLRSLRNRDEDALYLGSLDDSPDALPTRMLVKTNRGAAYAPSLVPGLGYLLYRRDEALVAHKFDEAALSLVGDAVVVIDRIPEGLGHNLLGVAASANDVLLLQTATSNGPAQLAWFDRAGTRVGKVGEPVRFGTTGGPNAAAVALALSPDGRRVAFSSRDPNNNNASLWLMDLTSGASSRLSFGAGLATAPVWSPDGRRVWYVSATGQTLAGSAVVVKSADGTGDTDRLLDAQPALKIPQSWSRDGRFLIFTSATQKTRGDLWAVSFADKATSGLIQTEANEDMPALSPDGRWIAYQSDESGARAMYVQPFNPPGVSAENHQSGKWLVSSGETALGKPRWRADGKELFYVGDDAMNAVEVSNTPTFRPGPPRKLFPWSFQGSWDVAPDGQRFLIAAPVEGQERDRYAVIVNWQSMLER